MIFTAFRCLGRAIVRSSLKEFLENVPLVRWGVNFCEAFIEDWKKAKAAEADRRAELQALAQAPPEEVRRQAVEIAAEVVPADAPPEVRTKLAGYLQQMPAVIRRTLTRRDDPTGRSVPPGLRLDTASDVRPFLPARPPRFQAGDRPPGVGDWELVELLGVGGFGEVWKAKNPFRTKAAPAALKFCLDESARDRLLRHEAHIVSQVRDEGKHTGIVELRHTYLTANPPCLEYEFIDGGDLAAYALQWHQAKPPFAAIVAWAATVIRTLAGTVGFAHRLDPPVVHRDLKPANILLQRRNDGAFDLRVADFGIGQIVGAQALEQTRGSGTHTMAPPNTVLGAYTPLYASPEQQNQEGPDPRDDVHALGVIWYQLLTGNLRLGAPTGLWAEHLKQDGMPWEQILLLGQCVAVEARHRPADGQVLAEKLAKLTVPNHAAVSREAKAGAEPRAPQARPEPRPPEPADPVERDLATIRQTNEAGRQAEAAHEYERGVKLFEALDERLRRKCDAALLGRLRDKHQRPTELEGRINAAVHNLDFTRRLAKDIADLLALQPGHNLGRHLRHCPAELKAGDVEALDLGNGVAMRFAWVPPGTFYMGGGGGQAGSQQVAIAEGFGLGVFPVTQAQWQAVMGNNPSHFARNGGGKDAVKGISDANLRQFPVENVSWEDAQMFLQKLNERFRGGEWLYRLPAEVEWEYSCRGGATSPADCAFHFYFDKPTNDISTAQANFETKLSRPTKVGSYKPNRLGLYDIHGNVWEWCADCCDLLRINNKCPFCHSMNEDGAVFCELCKSDLHSVAKGSSRVVRGGGWRSNGSDCLAYRGGYEPSLRISTLGLRLARVPRPT